MAPKAGTKAGKESIVETARGVSNGPSTIARALPVDCLSLH